MTHGKVKRGKSPKVLDEKKKKSKKTLFAWEQKVMDKINIPKGINFTRKRKEVEPKARSSNKRYQNQK